jgi:hypothetical protein
MMSKSRGFDEEESEGWADFIDCWFEGDNTQQKIEQLQASNAELVEALELYANKDNWGLDSWGIPAVFLKPYGGSWSPARKALAKHKGEG